ncbi:MAG: NYN domain-containing protein [Blastococcus sp.]|nr:NYN domain-containing protein [Blastococcus sp.]
MAVLIDCDNISWQLGGAVLAEAAKTGTLGVKRGYGDWSSSHLSGWKSQLALHAIQPMQQSAYIAGKNATDSALIIDAMDLLYSGNVDVFFLVSSDSDFTRLAMRLRESGRRVYGIGAQKTHVSFQNACDRFTFTEVLRGEAADALDAPGGREAPATAGSDRPAGATTRLDTSAVPGIKKVLVPALLATARDDGWAHLGMVGDHIVKNHPSFDSRNYGFARLGMLVRSLDFVEVKGVSAPDGSSQPWVSMRKQVPAGAA